MRRLPPTVCDSWAEDSVRLLLTKNPSRFFNCPGCQVHVWFCARTGLKVKCFSSIFPKKICRYEKKKCFPYKKILFFKENSTSSSIFSDTPITHTCAVRRCFYVHTAYSVTAYTYTAYTYVGTYIGHTLLRDGRPLPSSGTARFKSYERNT